MTLEFTPARGVIRREELLVAALELGGLTVELEDYATTGLRAVIVGPSGIGKTSAALLITEQLCAQGWVAVVVDPEGEIAALYGDAVASPAELSARLKARDRPVIVVNADSASAFIPYGEAVLQAADRYRKPVVLVVDETQLFSTSRRVGGEVGEANALMTDIVQRGRKRALDLIVTAHRFSGSLSRSIFTSKNLTLIGRAEDPTAWSGLAPLFRGSQVTFSELMTLSPGQFFAMTMRGIDRVTLRMPAALEKVAIKARPVTAALPSTYSQWIRALHAIPTRRLVKLTPEMVGLMASIVGLTPAQRAEGAAALAGEISVRKASPGRL